MQIPSISGNWVDLVISIFVFSFILSGLERGFIINLIDLTGFLISFAVSLKFYPLISHLLIVNFSLPIGISNALGFVLLGFITETIFFIFVRIFYQLLPKAITHSIVNKILGPVPAIINSLVIIAFFLSVVIATPIQPRIKKAIFDSRLGSPLIAKTQRLEQDMSKIFGDAVLDTLSFLTIQPESSEKVSLQFQVTNVTVDELSEIRMLDLVNSERLKVGLPALSPSEKIREVARAHAKDMFARGYFSHINPEGESPFDRLTGAGVIFVAAGENLAFAPTVELAHQGLMQSPGHRANILSADFGRVGIGVIDGGVYGRMFVQEFTN